MSPHLERAQLLFQQSRTELAEDELRQALTADPDDAYAHALLGLCLSECERFDEATRETELAIHLAPFFSFAHYAHARVFFDRNRYPEALTAITEAIRLDPQDANFFALLANIHVQERHWQPALEAAETGLQFNPEHVGCVNLRAIALVKLGRAAEAGITMDAALAKHPASSLTHANQGWTLLHQGNAKAAAEHFREALRLDPENEWARQGIIEALKARHFIYAVMLKYFLWMGRFSRRTQWLIILGGYIGSQILGSVGRANPALLPWILPVQLVYVAFVLMTWLAGPLFNLLLRLNQFGRLVLSREQTMATNWFGLCLGLTLTGFGGCCFAANKDPWIVVTIVFAALLLPVAAVFRCTPGWPRRIMAGLIGVMLLAGAAAIFLAFQTGKATDDVFTLGGFTLICGVGSTWLGNFLQMRRNRR